jgi:hypothetical protein
MNQVSDNIKKFFEDFERSSNTFESTLITSQFSDPFMAADPEGNLQVVKKDGFIAGIAKRQTFFQSIGLQSVKILPLDETRLDDHYAMVKARTHMRFEKNSGQIIDVTSYSIYILFMGYSSPKIVFYITHENLTNILQEAGILS